MVSDWWTIPFSAVAAGFAAQRVIMLRLAKISKGGEAAKRETRRMIVEKVAAQSQANLLLAQGSSLLKVLQHIYSAVHANDRRLRRG